MRILSSVSLPFSNSLPVLFCLAMPAVTLAQGVSEPWDVSQAAKNLSAQAERLKPLLDQLSPQEWQAKGAPAGYVTQRKNAQDELGYMMRAAANLSRDPEKLTVALETYFRLQALESQVTSLVEGVRRYQNPAVGDLIVSVMGANSSNRDQLRQYITDLAQTREQEFEIVDKEALALPRATDASTCETLRLLPNRQRLRQATRPLPPLLRIRLRKRIKGNNPHDRNSHFHLQHL